MNDDYPEDELTESCRYVIYSELPSGDVELRDPESNGDVAPDSPPRWWVLVKRPSEPPTGTPSRS